MKAIVWTAYGPPETLQLKEVEKPAPRDNESLIKILATSVTAGDCEMRSMKFPIWIRLPMRLFTGVWKPRKTSLGSYFAGEVEATGKNVTRFAKGDQIFGCSGFRLGCNAEYICLPEKARLAVKPANLSFEEAAAIPIGGLNALHFLRLANVGNGDEILINGAGGSIGTFAVQIAKLRGAKVTAVDSSDKLSMLRSIGADHVIDYAKEDFTKTGKSYDVIFDAVGKSPFFGSLRSLRKNGRYILGNPGMRQMIRSLFTPKKDGKKIIFKFADEKVEDLVYLKDLAEAGEIKPVMDKIYPLEQTAEAHRYIEKGLKKGNIVITIKHEQ